MHHYHVHTMQLQDVATLNWSLLGKLHGETYFAKPAMSGMPNCAGVVKQWSMLIIICIIFLHQHDNQPFRIVRPVHSFAERRHSSILPKHSHIQRECGIFLTLGLWYGLVVGQYIVQQMHCSWSHINSRRIV